MHRSLVTEKRCEHNAGLVFGLLNAILLIIHEFKPYQFNSYAVINVQCWDMLIFRRCHHTSSQQTTDIHSITVPWFGI